MNSFSPQLCEVVTIINLIYKWKNKDTRRQNNVISDTQVLSSPAGVLKLFKFYWNIVNMQYYTGFRCTS